MIVDALDDAWSHTMHEFGGCPTIGWNEKRSLEILDRALTEAVFSSHNRRWIQDHARKDGIVAINWIPDALSIAQLKSLGNLGLGTTIVYPGYGVATDEKKRLEGAFGLELHAFNGEPE